MKNIRILSWSLAFLTAFFVSFSGVSRADIYDHSASDGTLTDGMWRNLTNPPMKGSPGPGDDAYFYVSTITASGGSVHLLSGGTLSLSGMLTAVNVGEMTLSGSGTLNLQAVVTDANGFGPILNVTGGHLNVQNSDGVVEVTAGGTVIAAACSGTNGCGTYSGSGSSLTITGLGGPDLATFASGGKLTANSGLTGFNLQVLSGSTAVVSTITNSLATIDGAGSLLTVAGDVSLNPQSINISNGGAATVNGNLTQVAGGPLFVTGSGSSLTVVKDLKHNTGSDTDIRIYTGGTARVEGDLVQARGQVQVDAANSTLTVDQDLIDQGGFVDISNGGTLTVNGNLLVDGGFDLDGDAIGGGGSWTGTGTTINTSEPMFVGNQNSGGAYLFVGSKATVKSGNVTIGALAGVTGNVAMSDLGTIWEVQSNGMSIGENGTGTFTIDSGASLVCGTAFAVGLNSGSHGTLTLTDSVVDLTGAPTAVGASAGSTGSIVLNNSQLLADEIFIVGDSGSGNMNLNSGSTVTYSSSTNALVVGGKSGGAGSIVLNGAGATLTLSGSSLLTIGEGGTGSLSVINGAQVSFSKIDQVNLALGDTKGSSGTVTIDGSSFVAGLTTIGDFGVATFTAKNDANVLMQTFSAPRDAGGQATITVDNSTWENTGLLFLGNVAAGSPASTLLVENNATMRADTQMAIFQSGTATINTGGKMAVGSGAFGPAGSVRVSAGGILTGYGRVNGQVIVAAGGQIFPGNSPGIFNITGTFEQDAGATYSAEIGGTTAGTGFDQINATGAATVGGTLKVRLVQGFTPTVGQTFQIVKAASTSGSFATISEPSQAGISVANGAGGITVTVTSVVAGAPVISSATTATTAPGVPFSYQITATNNPTSYGATGLPSGLTVNNNTGIISGTPTATGSFVAAINANNAAGSGQADLVLTVDPVFGALPAQPSNLLNISTRLNVLNGDNVLIGGLIVTGTDPKQVLVRGIGPSLGALGVNGALADPVLELHLADGSIVTNDNWKDTQESTIAATGAAPTDELESAILATLDPGVYTVVLRGSNGATGIGLVEAYDLDQAAASTLANISTRGFVNTGDNAMIGGFIIGGGAGGSSTITVRAIGPSLTAAGVANALQDPTLELHSSNGDLIDSNDNWKDGASQQAIMDNHLAPTNDSESALYDLLAPGPYTAIVRGVNGTTGVGLVEVYNLD